MGYTCQACKKYERNDAGPCHHCGAARVVVEKPKPVVVNASPAPDPTPESAPDNPNAPRCRQCSKGVEDNYVFMKNELYHRNCYLYDILCANYHQKCFICTGCSKVLGDQFTEMNSWPWCSDCLESLEWKRKYVQETAERQEQLAKMRALEEALKNKTWEITFGQGGGFVVDPRTGQKRYTKKEVKIDTAPKD